ncbi:cellulose-binding protein [Gloeothece citriformis]|uniref:cellulose-binding protein n=1 Tax=Gloeothece citriformis TaxID=2546356 RepID=UPI001EF0074D|nr:cellulose-binding protein [Gloeothece citriformis]
MYLELVKNLHNTNSLTISESPKSVEIGTNLNGIADWSTQLPFIDGFKSSRPWITQTKGKWNTNETEQLNLDENGWVKSLPSAGSQQEYTWVGTLLYRGIEGRYPGGKYVVLYEGEGTIEYDYDAKKDEAASTLGRDVIDVTPSKAGIWLKITETDPNKTGNYIRNIHVVLQSYEQTYKTAFFNPTFLEKIRPFTTLRFMDWMDTNNSKQSQWSDRPTPERSTWAKIGVPVEIMVELANRLNANAWFCMPHQATDDYVKNFATYVRDHLKPELKIYVEYSNEVWNPQFKQFHWVEEHAGSLNRAQAYGKRATEIANIWDDVFGNQKERVIGVMAGQTPNPRVLQQAMQLADDSIDAMAIAAYVGGYIGKPDHEKELESWTKDPDGGLNKLFEEINNGGVLTKGQPGGALPQGWSNLDQLQELSQQYNVPLISYEGGQHLVGRKKVKNNKAINALFIQANRDPRMGEVYEKLLNQWFELVGGTLFMNFSDISKPNQHGSWGALEYVDQETSPKYQALLEKTRLSSTSPTLPKTN